MRLTIIEQFETHPGEVWALVPTERSRAAAEQAPVVDTPASLLQETHIRTAWDRRDKGMDWSPWLALSFRIPRPLDKDALAASLTAFVRRHGTLHTWFDVLKTPADDESGAPSTELRRRAVGAEDIELEWQTLGSVPDSERAVSMLHERFRNETSPLGWPGFVLGVIDHGPDPADGADGFSVHYAVDHSHTDALSMAFALYEMVEGYKAAVAGTSPELPEVGSYVDFSSTERDAAAAVDFNDPAVPAWLTAMEAVGGQLPRFVLPLGLEPGETAPSQRDMRLVADADGMAAFDEATRAAGGGTTAGLFAMLAEVDRRLGRSGAYMALNTTSTRFDPAHHFAQGWFINLVPISVPLPDDRAADAPYTDLVAAAQASVDLSKTAMRTPVRALLDLISSTTGTGLEQTQVPPIVSYLDKRKVPGGEHPDAVEKFGIAGPGNTGDVSLWLNRGSEGMFAAVSFPQTPEARTAVDRYLDTITEVLAQARSAQS